MRASFSSASAELARRLVRGIDGVLRRMTGVRDLSLDPDCILRVRLLSARRPILLPDRVLPAGETVLELHLWNERLPALPPGGADLAWSCQTAHEWNRSLATLAAYLSEDPLGSQVQALGATTVLGGSNDSPAGLLLRLGFSAAPKEDALGRFGAWWENAYAWALMWTFNPPSLRGRRLQDSRRTCYWISRRDFLSHFPPPRC